jgi:hypothetical protein
MTAQKSARNPDTTSRQVMTSDQNELPKTREEIEGVSDTRVCNMYVFLWNDPMSADGLFVYMYYGRTAVFVCVLL